jgi:hypothetical protein
VLHWPIPDPAVHDGSIGDRLDTYRAVFDLIRVNVDRFLADECVAPAAGTGAGGLRCL